MQILTSVDGDRAIITVEGKLTVTTSPELEAVVQQLEESGSYAGYDIDLSGLEYISSAGLRVLVATQKVVNGRGGSVRLLRPSESVMEVLEMTGLADVMTIEG